MIKKVYLSNIHSYNDVYDLDTDLNVGWFASVEPNKINCTNDLTAIEYSLPGVPLHSYAKTVDDTDGFVRYWFLVSKQTANQFTNHYRYILDCKATFPNEMLNSYIKRCSLYSLLNKPTATVEYPAKPVNVSPIFTTSDDTFFVNVSKSDAAITDGNPDTSQFLNNGMILGYDTFVFKVNTTTKQYRISKINAYLSGEFRYERNYDYKWQKRTANLSPLMVGVNLDEASSPWVEDGVITTITVPAGSSMGGGSFPEGNIYCTSTEDFQFQVIFNNGFPSITNNQKIPQRSYVMNSNGKWDIRLNNSGVLPQQMYWASYDDSQSRVLSGLYTFINNIQTKAGRKVLSVQKEWVPNTNYTTDSGKVGSMENITFINQYTDFKSKITVDDSLKPESLQVFGEEIPLIKQNMDDQTTDVVVAFSPKVSKPVLHVNVKYFDYTIAESIQSIGANVNVEYYTTAISEYNLNNSQADAMLTNQKNQMKFNADLQQQQRNVGLASSIVGSLGNIATGNIGGAVSSIADFATSSIFAGIQNENNIQQLDLKYKMNIQQIKDSPSNLVYGDDLVKISISNSLGMFHIKKDWIDPNIDRFITTYGIEFTTPYRLPEVEKGFMSLDLLPNRLTADTNDMYKSQTSFFYTANKLGSVPKDIKEAGVVKNAVQTEYACQMINNSVVLPISGSSYVLQYMVADNYKEYLQRYYGGNLTAYSIYNGVVDIAQMFPERNEDETIFFAPADCQLSALAGLVVSGDIFTSVFSNSQNCIFCTNQIDLQWYFDNIATVGITPEFHGMIQQNSKTYQFCNMVIDSITDNLVTFKDVSGDIISMNLQEFSVIG